MSRFDYATFRDWTRANDALEDWFATGEISEGEHPEIEQRETDNGTRFVVTMMIAY